MLITALIPSSSMRAFGWLSIDKQVVGQVENSPKT